MSDKGNLKYRAAIIGPADVVAGLKALGLDVFDATNGPEAEERIREAKEHGKYAMVLIIESLAREIPEDVFSKLTEGELPAFVSIPGIEGSSGRGEERLKELSEKALGSSIL